MTTNLRLTTEDMQNMLNLFDGSVRANGLQAAMLAVPLVVKIQAAHDKAEAAVVSKVTSVSEAQ